MIFKHSAALTLLLLLVVQTSEAQWFQYSATAMTTRVDLEFWSDKALSAALMSERVFQEIDRVENVMSSYMADSELSKVNLNASKRAVSVSPELYKVIQQAQKVSDLSEGAFDITFASIGYFYDFRRAVQPSLTELNASLANINYRFVELSKLKRAVRFLHEGVKVDLGGIAKGYAVDKGIEILQKAGVRYARLSAGGDMRLLGDKRGKPWVVGIKDPRSENKHALVLPLEGVAISTSGDYERFFIDAKGERVHHILSPKTGRPVKGIQSVTVIGEDTITTDGLSTAIFVLGVKKGLAMVNRLPGIDAIIIDSQRKLHYSDDLVDPSSAQ